MPKKKQTVEQQECAADAAESEPEFAPEPEAEKKMNIEIRDVNRQLKCKLTDTEKIEWGSKLAESIAAKKQAENDFASVREQCKATIAMHEAEISKAQNVVSSGFEVRDVKCVEEKNYTLGTVRVLRCDTPLYEVVEGRSMSDYERQQHLPLEGKPDAA